jgi:peptide/nickel transport system ATP-binding protein
MALLSTRLSARYGSKIVLEDVRLSIDPGEILGLVGQSGSGKSTMGLAVLGLLDRMGGRATGEILFEGRNLIGLKDRELRRIRGKQIALVLQSASAALNPALTLEDHFAEAWRAHEPSPWRDQRPITAATLAELDLPVSDEFLGRYPQQISTGQAQRVLIGLALLHRPKLIVADELTSALDIVTTHEVLNALRRANQISGTGILFISHDLGAVSALCHRVAILQSGRIVETASTESLFVSPEHHYTRELVALHRASR